jgi:hypothetical protein
MLFCCSFYSLFFRSRLIMLYVQGPGQLFKTAGEVEAPPRHGGFENSGTVRAANAAWRCRPVQVQSVPLPVVVLVFVIRFFSAAILASPIIDGEPALAPATAECDSAAVDEFFPKKRERTHAVWFDVPTRGGIGMIHVAKRKCPEVMFRYLNHLSKEEGREGWSFHAIEHDKSNDALLSPTKVRAFLVLPQSLCFVAVAHACLLAVSNVLLQPRVHPVRSGKTTLPPSPSSALFSGLSPRALRPSKDSFRSAAAFDWPPSPSDRPGSLQPGCGARRPRRRPCCDMFYFLSLLFVITVPVVQSHVWIRRQVKRESSVAVAAGQRRPPLRRRRRRGGCFPEGDQDPRCPRQVRRLLGRNRRLFQCRLVHGVAQGAEGCAEQGEGVGV